METLTLNLTSLHILKNFIRIKKPKNRDLKGKYNKENYPIVEDIVYVKDFHVVVLPALLK